MTARGSSGPPGRGTRAVSESRAVSASRSSRRRRTSAPSGTNACTRATPPMSSASAVCMRTETKDGTGAAADEAGTGGSCGTTLGGSTVAAVLRVTTPPFASCAGASAGCSSTLTGGGGM